MRKALNRSANFGRLGNETGEKSANVLRCARHLLVQLFESDAKKRDLLADIVVQLPTEPNALFVHRLQQPSIRNTKGCRGQARANRLAIRNDRVGSRGVSLKSAVRIGPEVRIHGHVHPLVRLTRVEE